MSNPESKLNRFNCGNKKSLERPTMRDDLLAFHKEWYSSNIMTLVLSSNHPLDDMEKWITEKFSEVVNKDVVLPDLVQPDPFTADQLGKIVKMVPIKDEDKLQMFWRMPYC
jgi:insulysin